MGIFDRPGAILRRYFQGRKLVADLEKFPAGSGRFLEFADKTFHMFCGEQNQLARSDALQIFGLRLKLMGIDTRFDMRPDLDAVAANVLGNFGQNRGEGRDQKGIRGAAGWVESEREKNERDRFHGGKERGRERAVVQLFCI